MLFAGWEVHIVKNCDRGLENAARGRRPRAAFSRPRQEVTVFHYTDRPKPVNNLFIFFLSLKRLCLLTGKSHASVTVTVVRDRKIRTALRTNQIAEFVTVAAWKKIKWIIIRCIFFFRFIGREPTTWPANNCLQIMVCSCVVLSKCDLLQIIFCSCVVVTTLSVKKWQVASGELSESDLNIKTNLVIEW